MGLSGVPDRPRPRRKATAAWAVPWAIAISAGLLAAGFTRQRYNGPSLAPSNDVEEGSRRARDFGHEGGRGRHASTPEEIPARGWKDILIRVYQNIGDDRVMLVAAGVTFYSLLSIFPALAAMVSLYGLFADPTKIADRVNNLSGVLPSGALDVIRDQLNRVASAGGTKLGVAFIIGFVVSLWSANAGIKSIFDALNLVYDEDEERGFIKLNAVSLLFTAAAILFVLIALGSIVALPAVFSTTGAHGASNLIGKVARWPILLAIVGVALAFIYRYGPSRARPQWRWVTWGSAFAAVGWVVVSVLFSLYTSSFSDYNKTYGSLGAVIGFMVWLWLATTVILIGAEIDAEMEHQTVRDTTTGHPKPLGARGATKADTVGAAQD